MVTDTFKRKEKLNTIVLLIVVSFAVKLTSLFPNLEKNALTLLITLATSKGLYELIIGGIFWVVKSTDMGLRMYWGKLYLKGFWSYQYNLNGKAYLGVWEIHQDTDGLSLIGNGLDDNYQMRTVVRSVSSLIEETGGYFFINSRNELREENVKVFSKTTLLIDRGGGLFSRPKSMRGFTEIFGGPSDKQYHPSVKFQKHDDVNSIEELIAKLTKANKVG